MPLIRGFLRVLVVVGVAQAWLACSSKGGATRQASVSRIVAEPLTVSVKVPALLASVSALLIRQPSLSGAVTDRAVSPVALGEIIEARAQELLAMKVISGGNNVRADAVLNTEILSYRERQGSSIGGEPATVSFNMTVQRLSDGVEIWRANYFYRQEALSDNWLKVGQRFGSGGTGAGWLPAREILERGIVAALRDLSNRRDQQFLSNPARG